MCYLGFCRARILKWEKTIKAIFWVHLLYVIACHTNDPLYENSIRIWRITITKKNNDYLMANIYTLFNVLVDNMRRYFKSCMVFFWALQWQGKMLAMSKFPCVLSTKQRILKKFIISFHFDFAMPSFSKTTVERWHILRVLLTLYGKMTQRWNNN